MQKHLSKLMLTYITIVLSLFCCYFCSCNNPTPYQWSPDLQLYGTWETVASNNVGLLSEYLGTLVFTDSSYHVASRHSPQFSLCNTLFAQSHFFANYKNIDGLWFSYNDTLVLRPVYSAVITYDTNFQCLCTNDEYFYDASTTLPVLSQMFLYVNYQISNDTLTLFRLGYSNVNDQEWIKYAKN